MKYIAVEVGGQDSTAHNEEDEIRLCVFDWRTAEGRISKSDVRRIQELIRTGRVAEAFGVYQYLNGRGS